MGLIANRAAVEMLCKLAEKLTRACGKNDNKSEKENRDGNGKGQKL